MVHRGLYYQCDAFETKAGFIAATFFEGSTFLVPDLATTPDAPLFETAELAFDAAMALGVRMIDEKLDAPAPRDGDVAAT